MGLIRYVIFIIVLLPLISQYGCKPSPPEHRFIGTNSGNWELVWSDEFDYTGLPDPQKWNFDTAGNSLGWGNNELQWYTEDKENVFVENGILTVTAIKKQISDKQYTSARLTTKGKGDWKYGRVEVRAKFPQGKGPWSAIWMLPTEDYYGAWPKSGEIDIAGYVGFDLDSVYTSVHTEKYNQLADTCVGAAAKCGTLPSEFHVYSIEWEKDEIRSYMDGQLYFTFYNDNEGQYAWPFDQKFHLLLNLAIGGDWGAREGVDDMLFPHRMEIDYVRVYKKMI